MGEDRFRADQTRYVCRNPDDDSLLGIRYVADSSEPQAQRILTAASVELVCELCEGMRGDYHETTLLDAKQERLAEEDSQRLKSA
jgi:hypothetical protein